MSSSVDPAALAGTPAIQRERQAAWQQLGDSHLPDSQDEQWRKTGLTPMVAALGERWWQPCGTQGVESSHYIDGALRIGSDGSVIDPLPTGITVTPLRQLLERGGADSPITHSADDYTSCLNSSWVEDGLSLHLAENTTIEQPLQIVDHHGTGATYRLSHIHLGVGAQLTVVEALTSSTTGVDCIRMECHLQAEATLNHYRLQQHGSRHFHLGSVVVNLDRSASYNLHAVELGGSISRLDLITNLNQAGASCDIHGLMVLNGRQHTDHHITINHTAPHCHSRINYRTILNDRAHAVFNGRVVVAKGASGTDSAQHSGNILLSKRAQIDTTPELEIYNDDVKCAHGATIGQLDSEHLFYLQSRGLSEDEARKLLIHAFAESVLMGITTPHLRQQIEQSVTTKLNSGD
ncbi:MAG: Fe-S cluster assembly protein SufD [Mariprofundales bacterium]|nr:Fe-S cluster assembly protein SufD [Mariprofundales bacterium]